MNEHANRRVQFSANELALYSMGLASPELVHEIAEAMQNEPKLSAIIGESKSIDRWMEELDLPPEHSVQIQPQRSIGPLTIGAGSLAATIMLILGYFFLLHQPQMAYAAEAAAVQRIVQDLAQYFDIVSENTEDKELLRKIDRELDQFTPKTELFKRKKHNLYAQRNFVRSISLAKRGLVIEAHRVHAFAEDLLGKNGDSFTVFYRQFSKGVIEHQSARMRRKQHGFTNASKEFALAEQMITEQPKFFSSHPLAVARFYGHYAVNLTKSGQDKLGKEKFDLAFLWLDKAPKEAKKNSPWLRAYCRFNADKSLYFNHLQAWEKSYALLDKTITEIEPVPDMNFLRGLLYNNLADSYLDQRSVMGSKSNIAEVNARVQAIKELRIAFSNRQTVSTSQNFHLALVRGAILRTSEKKYDHAIAIFDKEILRFFPINPFDENKQTGTHEEVLLYLVGANSSRLNTNQKQANVEDAFKRLSQEKFAIDHTFVPMCLALLDLPSCPQTSNKEKFVQRLKELKESHSRTSK